MIVHFVGNCRLNLELIWIKKVEELHRRSAWNIAWKFWKKFLSETVENSFGEVDGKAMRNVEPELEG